MKILKWIGAAIAFLFAVKYASDARRAEQRSEAITNKQVEELAKGKQANLAKAAKLSKKADAQFAKAKDAKAKAEHKAKQLEKSNETDLANRVRDFNERL